MRDPIDDAGSVLGPVVARVGRRVRLGLMFTLPFVVVSAIGTALFDEQPSELAPAEDQAPSAQAPGPTMTRERIDYWQARLDERRFEEMSGQQAAALDPERFSAYVAWLHRRHDSASTSASARSW